MTHDTTLPTRPMLSAAAAAAVMTAAEDEAARRACRVTVAVVDDGGHLVLLKRMDGVHTGTVEVALAKARTAAAFRRPSRLLAEGLAGGASVLLVLPGCLPVEGGVPIVHGGHTIGAVGVSGAAAPVDDAVAAAAAAAVPDRSAG